MTGTIDIGTMEAIQSGLSSEDAVIGLFKGEPTPISLNALVDFINVSELNRLGTVTEGEWKGKVIAPEFGGTGYNNSHTLYVKSHSTVDGTFFGMFSGTVSTGTNLVAFVGSGNSCTINLEEDTTITFPTRGRLITDDVSMLMNLQYIGIIKSGQWNGNVIQPQWGGTGYNNGFNTISLSASFAITGFNPIELCTFEGSKAKLSVPSGEHTVAVLDREQFFTKTQKISVKNGVGGLIIHGELGEALRIADLEDYYTFIIRQDGVIRTKDYFSVCFENDPFLHGNKERLILHTKSIEFNGLNLVAKDENTLSLRNGSKPQNIELYNKHINKTNYEKATVGWKNGAFVVHTDVSGAGLPRSLVLQAANVGVCSDYFGGGKGILSLGECKTIPTVPNTKGGYFFVKDGALHYMGSKGTVTEIAEA